MPHAFAAVAPEPDPEVGPELAAAGGFEPPGAEPPGSAPVEHPDSAAAATAKVRSGMILRTTSLPIRADWFGLIISVPAAA